MIVFEEKILKPKINCCGWKIGKFLISIYLIWWAFSTSSNADSSVPAYVSKEKPSKGEGGGYALSIDNRQRQGDRVLLRPSPTLQLLFWRTKTTVKNHRNPVVRGEIIRSRRDTKYSPRSTETTSRHRLARAEPVPPTSYYELSKCVYSARTRVIYYV